VKAIMARSASGRLLSSLSGVVMVLEPEFLHTLHAEAVEMHQFGVHAVVAVGDDHPELFLNRAR